MELSKTQISRMVDLLSDYYVENIVGSVELITALRKEFGQNIGKLVISDQIKDNTVLLIKYKL